MSSEGQPLAHPSYRLLWSAPIWRTYSAVDSEENRLLVTRLLPPPIQVEETGRTPLEIVEQHAAMRVSVRHPFVPRILGVHPAPGEGIDYSEPMPLGNSISTLVRRTGPLRANFVASLVWNVARALDSLHKAGGVHLALTPDNLIVGADANVSMLNVGLASICHEMIPEFRFPDSRWEYVFPEPALTAPELMGRDEPTPQADVFLLSGLTFYLLTGSMPYVGADAMEVYAQARRGQPPELRKFRAKASPSLERALVQGLSPYAEERHGSVLEAAEALFGPYERMDPLEEVSEPYQLFLSHRPLDAYISTQLERTPALSVAGIESVTKQGERAQALAAASSVLEMRKHTRSARESSRRIELIALLVAALFALIAIPFFFMVK